MNARGVVPSPTPYMRDTGQSAGVGTPDGTNLGQVSSTPTSEAQETAAVSQTLWDNVRDISGTKDQKPCPRPLIPVGKAYTVSWTMADWRGFQSERVAIRQYDGGMTEREAAHWAWLDCIAKWMERHPPIEAATRAWTGTPEELRLARLADAEICLERLGLARTD